MLWGLLLFPRTIFSMFARRISVEYEAEGGWVPAPMKWLDNFAMRSFTNDSAFDDTLPVADGRMEIGSRVRLKPLQLAMEDWFRRKGYIAPDKALKLIEQHAV